MKRLALCLLILCACAVAQNPSVNPQPVTASSVTFPPITPALDPITNASVSRIGNPGPARYCYWLVTNYQVGPVGPTKVRPCITNAAGTLSSSNYDQVSFNLPPGAVSVDVLRTTGSGIDQAPKGSCACAVATANTTGTVQDQSNSLSGYTVSSFDISVLNIGLTNEVVGAGASHLKLRQNGQLVGDISALANGLADPGANGIVFRSAANTTRPAVLGDVTALGSTGTGNLVLANAPTFTANPTFASQTGTGAVVLANAPTFTANPTFASQTGSGAVVLANAPTITGTTSFSNQVNFNGELAVNVGILPGEAGYKSIRISGTCTTAASAGSTCTFTTTWPTAFPDANYTPVCTGIPGTGVPALNISSFSASQIVLQVVALTGVGASYATVDCVAPHD
jgi:hypothetical protein